jgi:DNA modification methylase
MNYSEFLETKKGKTKTVGFDIDENELNPKLKDFQKHLIKRHLKLGRAGNFSDTGLGKAFMLLEWSYQVSKHENKPVLITAPLGVTVQLLKEASKFGYDLQRYKGGFVTNDIWITNYEQVYKMTDISHFIGIALDESSILKSYTGKIRNYFTKLCRDIKYKYVLSATPSPNQVDEIGQQAEFLGVLDARDMRAKWFVRDEGMNNYRLKKHAKQDFYGWLKSWCDIVTSPSDLGFYETAKEYKLPKLNRHYYEIKSEKKQNGKLFNDVSVNSTDHNAELRRTIVERMQYVTNIIQQNKNEQILVWVKINDEADYLKKVLSELNIDFREVRGNDKPEIKEKNLIEFAENKYKVLITKSKIAGFGMNYQNCNIHIEPSIDFSFEGLYQRNRRSWRFGQNKDVDIYIVTVDTMQNVQVAIERKQKQFDELKRGLSTAINKKYGLIMDYNREEIKTDNYHIIKGDSCVEIGTFEGDTFDFSIFSPPFSNLFIYSNSYRDMGNNENNEEFFKQNAFLLTQLFHKMKPGGLVAVHSKDLAVYKGSSGYTGLYDFTGDYHRAMETAGFKYHSKITIWTDPVLEMQRTKTQRLLYKQLRKDSRYSGVGLPEYITLFKKWDGIDNFENYEPVNNKTFENFPLDTWQEWASPVWGARIGKQNLIELIKHYYEANGVNLNDESKWDLTPDWFTGSWFDIKRTDVLNSKEGTDLGDEKHIAPLQLTVIQRCLQMWTNPGNVVFTPFMGIGSEVYKSVELGRYGVGIELKDSYFEAATKNINNIISKKNELTLF